MPANVRPLVIKRVKKGSHRHHGGAWKVAYADFVTAMMAFFLMLWLLNSTTAEQRQGISDYFAPASASPTRSGSGGLLGGHTFASDGMPQNSTVVRPASSDPNRPSEGQRRDFNRDDPDSAGAGEDVGREVGQMEELFQEEAELAESNDRFAALSLEDRMWALARAETVAAREEARNLARLAGEIMGDVQKSPALKPHAASVVAEQTREGLRLDVLARTDVEMFASGGTELLPHAVGILRTIVERVKTEGHRVAIEGHTDASPSRRADYSNWELSADRANAARRKLVELGLPPDRIASVIGRAATRPLVPERPDAPENRRITITLLRQHPGSADPGEADAALPADSR